MKTHLLIDGDIVAFTAAATAQEQYIDSFGWKFPMANLRVGEVNVENMLHALKVGLKADSFEVYLSDPAENWRTGVDPTYKTNRTGERPIILDELKQYLRDEHGATHWAGLEADDTLSLLATHPSVAQGTATEEVYGGHGTVVELETRLVVVGRDKDFKSIPGLHHAWKQDLDAKGNMLVREVTPWEADAFHLAQALAGDRTDGFYGCPGIGMTRAHAIIKNPVRLVPAEGVKTRGVNKGEAVTKWVAEPTKDYWACIVSHYRKQGLTEDDALVTARLARLLRHGEYDRETHEVTLWVPEMLERR